MKNTKLIAARHEADYTQEALAREAGIHRVAYSYIENGMALPTEEAATKLADLLGKTPEELFGRKTESRAAATAISPEILNASETAALQKAVKELGYTGIAEWIREKYRDALRACAFSDQNAKGIRSFDTAKD